MLSKIALVQPSMPVATDVTQILQAWSDGDDSAPERLMPVVYRELRRLAGEYLRRERPDHTLQATALVHEAYLKLVDDQRVTWKSRAHFCGIAARLMRQILVEHARSHNAAKRGGRLEKMYLEETRHLAQQRAPDIIALDEALQTLATSHPRESEVVELKFFGGLDAREIAEVLNVSPTTVSRDWTFAKLWLLRQLNNAA
jgi:RNA polymerase sigma factor (TIGR02999 family)